MKIKKLTINVTHNKDGSISTALDIDTFKKDDSVRGVEAIKVLNEAIAMILEQVV